MELSKKKVPRQYVYFEDEHHRSCTSDKAKHVIKVIERWIYDEKVAQLDLAIKCLEHVYRYEIPYPAHEAAMTLQKISELDKDCITYIDYDNYRKTKLDRAELISCVYKILDALGKYSLSKEDKLNKLIREYAKRSLDLVESVLR